MSAPQPQLSRRELYRRERQLKQNSIFSIVFSVMAGVSVLSLLVLTGILPIPFLNGFSAKVEYAGRRYPLPQRRNPASCGLGNQGSSTEHNLAFRGCARRLGHAEDRRFPGRGSLQLLTGVRGIGTNPSRTAVSGPGLHGGTFLPLIASDTD